MGPLKGLKIIEMAGIGPAPFCGMLLADMGAEVVKVDRLVASGVGIPVPSKFDLLNRNKRSIAIDLKSHEGKETILKMIGEADALIEGFRPGVMERLGLGPDECLKRNERLVYGRMTGWGQDGPLSQSAGHDLNYIALNGVLNTIGCKGEAPVIPLNLIGDFGGGSLYLAMGMLAAIYSCGRGGKGQVVDAAIIDGSSSMLSLIYSYYQMGGWSLERGTNVVDGGSPFYAVYQTLDNKYITLGAVEEKFYREFLARVGLADEELPSQNDPKGWPLLKQRFTELFKSKTRDQWCALLEGTDACFAPVLDIQESLKHPHNVERGIHVDLGGVVHPAPAPRFSQTVSEIRSSASPIGSESVDILKDWGFDDEIIGSLITNELIKV